MEQQNLELKELIKELSTKIPGLNKEENSELEGTIENSEHQEGVQEESKDVGTRGKDSLIENILVQNFMLLFGAKPGHGVSTKTQFIFDVMSCFEKYYDILT